IDKINANTIVPIELRYTDKILKYNLNTLPADMPETGMENNANIDGYIITSFHTLTLDRPSYTVIMNTNGDFVYYMGTDNPKTNIFHMQRWDFAKQPLYSYHIQTQKPTSGAFLLGDNVVLDDKFNEIDRVRILATDRHPEMPADQHDFVILGDKHYLVISYWNEELEKNKTVLSAVVQEHKNGKVIFDWVSSDYPKLFDICIEKCPAPGKTDMDYVHINSVAVDPSDNNLVLSLASPHTVIKINRKSGDIMWTLSGQGDDFNVAPEYRMTRQHDAHLENGELVIFDNNYSVIKKISSVPDKKDKARILRFKLDEKNKQVLDAKSVPLNITAQYMGSAQGLKEDRYFVGCGSAESCAAKMLDATGQEILKMTVKYPYTAYRAYFYESLD
ncbi:MAG: aryl-sulfate sulfotransferase, partial [Alphaproteobacteria bacterium]|nr:aryl-sulfate sulfotransferase [Alphaproteobacteria bacterium]